MSTRRPSPRPRPRARARSGRPASGCWPLRDGDALAALRSLADASVDAAADPPHSSGGFTRELGQLHGPAAAGPLDETIACPNNDTIVSASAPPQIVERGKLADTLIVEAVCDKYIEHLPVERQCVAGHTDPEETDTTSGRRGSADPRSSRSRFLGVRLSILGALEGRLLIAPGLGVDVDDMAVLGEAVDEGAEARPAVDARSRGVKLPMPLRG
jgi:hypothetical protein